jgi:hypothetical protein
LNHFFILSVSIFNIHLGNWAIWQLGTIASIDSRYSRQIECLQASSLQDACDRKKVKVAQIDDET